MAWRRLTLCFRRLHREQANATRPRRAITTLMLRPGPGPGAVVLAGL
jgi:hypothetical protein